jgi:ring-1,2-phenylacetyl-CoA epoxidase subunit PaaE
MSILRSVLHSEPKSRVTLVFGNRNLESVIFGKRLAEIEAQYPGRFQFIQALTQPAPGWTGNTGRLTRGKVKEILGSFVQAETLEKEFFVCGPSAMMDEALHALKEMQVRPEKVHQEHFSAPITHPMEEEQPVKEGIAKYDIQLILEGTEHTITVSPNQSILEAALDNDLDPPYACMIGSCCTCKAKLISGKVIMDDREGLTDDEIAEGYVLTCQSHPTTSNVTVNYDQF